MTQAFRVRTLYFKANKYCLFCSLSLFSFNSALFCGYEQVPGHTLGNWIGTAD